MTSFKIQLVYVRTMFKVSRYFSVETQRPLERTAISSLQERLLEPEY